MVEIKGDIMLAMILVVAIITSSMVAEAGILCYNCTSPHDGICERIVECGDNEACYRSGEIIPTRGIMYTSGCRPKKECHASQHVGSIIFGRRDGTPKCSQCCGTPYCNMALCDIHHTVSVVPDPCESSPCLHNGHCVKTSDNEFECSCPAGYIGTRCETVDSCHGHQYFKWNGHCYYLSRNTYSWEHNPCHNIGMELAVIDNEQEYNVLVHFIRSVVYQIHYIWLGANKIHDNWRWFNGHSIYDNNPHWKSHKYGGKCLALERMSMQYIEGICYYHHNALCESPLTSHLLSQLTRQVHTNDLTTLPSEADKQACNGQRYFTWHNRCYYISDELKEWKTHKTVNYDPCHTKNMTLAVVDIRSEYNAILHYVRDVVGESRTFWLGGRYNVKDHTWKWINGDVIIPHSPHWEGTSGGRHTHPYCMVMDGRMWDNRNCNDLHLHLCESGEFQVHLIPLITSDNCTGINYFQFGGHCYYFLNDTKRIHGHEPCKTLGDHFNLTVINSDAEQMAISHFVRDIMNYSDVVWLHGYYVHYNGHGFWGWSHTEKMDLHSSNWKENPYQNQGCVVLDGHQWGIRKCEELHYQLCEGIMCYNCTSPHDGICEHIDECDNSTWLGSRDMRVFNIIHT